MPDYSSESHPYVASETRLQHLMRHGHAQARFLQGVYPFAGRGVFEPCPLNNALSHVVPQGKTAEVLYFRAGNLSDALLYLTLTANSLAVRYFPIGARADIHVPLVIVESYPAGTCFDVCLAAPRGVSGTVVLDIGLVEVDAGR